MTGIMGHLFAWEVHTFAVGTDMVNLFFSAFAVALVPAYVLGRWSARLAGEKALSDEDKAPAESKSTTTAASKAESSARASTSCRSSWSLRRWVYSYTQMCAVVRPPMGLPLVISIAPTRSRNRKAP